MSDDSADHMESEEYLNIDRRGLVKTGVVLAASGTLAGCGQKNSGNGNGNGGGGGEGVSDKVVKLDLYGISRQEGAETFAMFKQVEKQLEQLGIQINYVAQSNQEWINTNYSDPRGYKMSYLAWGGDANRIDPLRYLGLYWSELGGYNSTRYSNPEYDEVYVTLAQSSDRQERKEAAYKCQEILCEDAVTPVLTYPIMKGGINTEKFSNWKSMPGNIPYRNVWTLTSLKPKTDDTTVFQPIVSPPDRINPMGLKGNVDNIYHRLVYDRLVRLGPDDGAPQPSSAESWEWQDDTTIDVTLKDGLVFTDGKPVRPEDVKFTWEYFREQGHPYFASHFDSFDTIEVTGDLSLRFNLKNPDAGLVSYGFYIMPILPQHVWEGVTERENIDHPRNWSNPDYTANGPFKPVEVNLPERMIVEVNEDYHMDFNGIEQFIVQNFGGFEQALVELQNGNAAFVNSILTNQFKRIKSNKGGNWDHVEPFSKKMINWQVIQFHMERKPSNNKAFRQAISHALNQEALVDIAFDGIGAQPGFSGNVVAPSNKFWHNPDVKTYEGGPEKGRELLKEAGFGWDNQDRLLYPEDMLPIKPVPE